MGLIERLLKPRATYSPIDDFWYNPPHEMGTTAAGVPMSEYQALTISAFFAGVRIISECLAVPSLITYQRINENGKQKARRYGLFKVLHDRPNSWQTSFEYRTLQQARVILSGNAYSLIVPGENGPVSQLIPLEPHRMKVIMLSNHRIGYSYRDTDSTTKSYVQDEIFHLRNTVPGGDGVTGISTVSYARDSLGLSKVVDTYGSKLFSNGAMHNGVLTVPQALKPDQRDALRQQVREQTVGSSGWHNTLILESGTTWAGTTMNADDAQFLLTRKHQVVETARWLNIPPHLLRDLEKSSYSNHEQETLEFVQITMLPHYTNWEQAISRDLIVDADKYFAEHLLDTIMRADIQARYAAYEKAIRNTIMKPNEARIKENMDPDPRLDDFKTEINMRFLRDPVPEQRSGSDRRQGDPPERDQDSGTQKRREEDENTARFNAEEAEKRQDQLDRELLERLSHADRVVRASAERALRKEGLSLAKALARYADEPDKLEKWSQQFYSDHAEFIAEILCVDQEKAAKFATHQRERLLLSVKDNCAGDLIRELESAEPSYVLEFLRNGHNGNGAAEAA